MSFCCLGFANYIIKMRNVGDALSVFRIIYNPTQKRTTQLPGEQLPKTLRATYKLPQPKVNIPFLII